MAATKRRPARAKPAQPKTTTGQSRKNPSTHAATSAARTHAKQVQLDEKQVQLKRRTSRRLRRVPPTANSSMTSVLDPPPAETEVEDQSQMESAPSPKPSSVSQDSDHSEPPKRRAAPQRPSYQRLSSSQRPSLSQRLSSSQRPSSSRRTSSQHMSSSQRLASKHRSISQRQQDLSEQSSEDDHPSALPPSRLNHRKAPRIPRRRPAKATTSGPSASCTRGTQIRRARRIDTPLMWVDENGRPKTDEEIRGLFASFSHSIYPTLIYAL